MSYGYGSYNDPKVVHEKAWKRASATAHDAAWHRLSTAARRAYLDLVKPTSPGERAPQVGTPVDRFDPDALAELVRAGLVRIVAGLIRKPNQAVPEPETLAFSARIRAIARANALGGKPESEGLLRFIRYAFHSEGRATIHAILASAGIGQIDGLHEALNLYVGSRHWPGWAAAEAGGGATLAVIEALAKAPGPVPLADLPALVGPVAPPKAKAKAKPKGKPKAGAGAEGEGPLTPQQAADALDRLIARLAVFEGLDPASLDLVVGFLPAVRKRMEEAAKPRPRPPLIACKEPREIGPHSGLATQDIRSFLLEVAASSPRLRQDGGLFVKEFPRFEAALVAWPDWLYEVLGIEVADRVEEAFDHAIDFKLVERDGSEDRTRVRLGPQGSRWLALGLEEQYAWIYGRLRGEGPKPAPRSRYDDGYDVRGNRGDADFLGIAAAIYPGKGAGRSSYYSYSYSEPKPEHVRALREALRLSLEELPVGVYHRLDSILAHLGFADRNPVARALRDLKAIEPAMTLGLKAVPNLPESIEAAGTKLLNAFLGNRLLLFDAVRVAVDAEDHVCLARLPRSDGYFGRPYEMGESDGAGTTRVIVQPDFSVVVIGLDPAPLAELAPFCDRAPGPAGQGATTYKITRASVTRAASNGLTGQQIVDRLARHASVPVPPNILTEVRGWAGWVRRVNVRELTVVRCSDREAADRVLAVLGRRGERIADALVAIDVRKVSSADRAKLQNAGIIITKDDIGPAVAAKPAPTPAAPAAPKRRGRPPKVR